MVMKTFINLGDFMHKLSKSHFSQFAKTSHIFVCDVKKFES